jgi:hypothetical protein
MNPDEQDELWELLGKAKTPAVSPFFARNVLRAVREQRQEKGGMFAWLHGPWRVATIGAFALLLASLGLLHPTVPQNEQMTLLAQKVSASPDYDVISHLDELLDSEENSVWLDGRGY